MPGPEELAAAVAAQAADEQAAPPVADSPPRRGRGRPPTPGSPRSKYSTEGAPRVTRAARVATPPAPPTPEELERLARMNYLKGLICKVALTSPFTIMHKIRSNQHSEEEAEFWKLTPGEEGVFETLGVTFAEIFLTSTDPRWILLAGGFLAYGSALSPRIVEDRRRWGKKPEEKKKNGQPDNRGPGAQGVGKVVVEPGNPVEPAAPSPPGHAPGA